jgi:hypothetical protein
VVVKLVRGSDERRVSIVENNEDVRTPLGMVNDDNRTMRSSRAEIVE